MTIAETRTQNIIDAQFEVFEALGKGGTSTVYRARDRETDEIVALKAEKFFEKYTKNTINTAGTVTPLYFAAI